jgi:hypothetical protein
VAYIQVTKPPQQKPVTASLATSALPGFSVGDGGVEVGHDLFGRRLLDDLRDDLLRIGDFGRVPLPREELGGDREIAGLGEAAANILDVLVHPPNL